MCECCSFCCSRVTRFRSLCPHYIANLYIDVATLFRCLTKLADDKGDDRDEYIDAVLFGIRTSVQESTKFSPFFLMHGREARLPTEVQHAAMPDDSSSPNVASVIDRLQKVKEEIFPQAKKNIDKSQKKQKEHYLKRKGLYKPSFKAGDMVLRLNMVKRTTKGHKMEDTWLGPYKVLEITKYGCCLLKCLKTSTVMKRKINTSQLKLYRQSPDASKQVFYKNSYLAFTIHIYSDFSLCREHVRIMRSIQLMKW